MSRSSKSKRKAPANLTKRKGQDKQQKLKTDLYYDDTVNIETTSGSETDDDEVVCLDEDVKEPQKPSLVRCSSHTDWCEKYAPQDRASLVVHKQKLIELEDTLRSVLDGKSSPGGKYSNIIVLTGPSGCEKSSALRVMANEMGVQLIEWQRATSQQSTWNEPRSSDQQPDRFGGGADHLHDLDGFDDFASESRVFDRFIMNSMRRNTLNLFADGNDATVEIKCERNDKSAATPRRKFPNARILLVRELPTVYVMNVAAFHNLLEMVSQQSRALSQPVCVVFIITTQALQFRGATEHEFRSESSERSTFGRSVRRDAFETLFPLNSLRTRGVTINLVRFNPITALNAQKALRAVIDQERACGNPNLSRLSNESLSAMVAELVASANCDLRCAVNTLQFRVGSTFYEANRKRKAATVKAKSKAKAKSSRTGATTSHEGSKDDRLTLFRAIGRLIYYDPAKYGDRISAESASTDVTWSSISHDDGSMVEDAFYRSDVADSFDLFSAMLHESYCDAFVDTDVVTGLADTFSEIDALAGHDVQIDQRRNIEPVRVSILTRSFVDAHARSTARAKRTFSACRPSLLLRLRRAISDCRSSVAEKLLQPDANGVSGRPQEKRQSPFGVGTSYRNGAAMFTEVLPFAGQIGLPNRSHLGLSHAQKAALFAVSSFNDARRRQMNVTGDALADAEENDNEVGEARSGDDWDTTTAVCDPKVNGVEMYLDDVEIEDPDT